MLGINPPALVPTQPFFSPTLGALFNNQQLHSHPEPSCSAVSSAKHLIRVLPTKHGNKFDFGLTRIRF